MSRNKSVNGPDKGVVYLIEHEHGYVKIGRSANPRQRLSELQTACPYELSVIGILDTADAVETENKLHEKYESKQKSGEWFNLSDRQKRHLVAMADLDVRQIDWRYLNSESERRKRTLLYQGLMG